MQVAKRGPRADRASERRRSDAKAITTGRYTHPHGGWLALGLLGIGLGLTAGAVLGPLGGGLIDYAQSSVLVVRDGDHVA